MSDVESQEERLVLLFRVVRKARALRDVTRNDVLYPEAKEAWKELDEALTALDDAALDSHEADTGAGPL